MLRCWLLCHLSMVQWGMLSHDLTGCLHMISLHVWVRIGHLCPGDPCRKPLDTEIALFCPAYLLRGDGTRNAQITPQHVSIVEDRHWSRVGPGLGDAFLHPPTPLADATSQTTQRFQSSVSH